MTGKTKCSVVKKAKEAPKKLKRAKKGKKASEPEYSIAKLAESAESFFGTKAVIVRAALKMAQKEKYTGEEAKKIVSEFIMKEVK